MTEAGRGLERPLAALFVLLNAILFLQFLFVPGPNTLVLRLLGVLLPLPLLAWALGARRDPRVAVPRVVVWAGGLWLLLGAFSVTASAHQAPALLRQLEWTVYAALAAVLVIAFYDRARTAEVFLWTLLAGVVVAIAAIAWRWCVLDDPRSYDWIWGAVPFIHIRHLGYYLAAGTAAALYPCLAPGSGLRQGAGFALLTLVLAALFWAGGRGSVLAILVAMPLVLCLAPATPEKRRLLIALPFILVGAYGLAAVFQVDNPAMGLSLFHGRAPGDIDDLSSGRVALWLSVLPRLLDSPWLGVGPDNYGFLADKPAMPTQPHSFVLQALLDWGLPGGGLLLLTVLGLCLWLVGFFWRGRAAALPVAPLVVFGVLVAILAYGLIDGSLYHYPTMALGPVALGLVYGCTLHRDGRGEAGAEPLLRRRATALGLLAMTGLVAVLGLANIRAVIEGYRGRVWDYYAPRMVLLRALPIYATDVPAWTAYWQERSPEVMTHWLGWLQRQARDGWQYYLWEANAHLANGDPARARALYAEGLTHAPLDLRDTIARSELARQLGVGIPDKVGP
ncbi:MAG: O-antigen ligase family protein [Porticoccaceae bacterium]